MFHVRTTHTLKLKITATLTTFKYLSVQHKIVSLISTKHSGYKNFYPQQLNIKQRIATKCALMCFLQ